MVAIFPCRNRVPCGGVLAQYAILRLASAFGTEWRYSAGKGLDKGNRRGKWRGGGYLLIPAFAAVLEAIIKYLQ